MARPWEQIYKFVDRTYNLFQWLDAIAGHSPALRASRSCLPFSISSSSFRYRSLSSRSLFSESSRTDLRKAAGSKSSFSAFSVVSETDCVRACANGECCELRRSGEVVLCRGGGGEAASTTEEAITNNTTRHGLEQVDRDPRPRVHKASSRTCKRVRWWTAGGKLMYCRTGTVFS